MREVFYNKYDDCHTMEDYLNLKNWPRKGQSLFVEAKSSTPKQVIIHFGEVENSNNDFLLPESFKELGDFSIEVLLKGGDGTHPDRFLFPILYYYRHAVELKMKEIIRIGILLNLNSDESVKNIINKHDLHSIWVQSKEIISAFWPNSDEEVLDIVEKFIQDFHNIDPDGQRLRYSRSNKGLAYQYSLPKTIDLIHLRDVIDGLWNLLCGASDGLNEGVYCLEEMNREYMSYYDY